MSDPVLGEARDVPAVWMRGGTSKGLFLHLKDVPRQPRLRDALVLRLLGSPDPYERQTDGLGGATSSTSKVVLVWPSHREDCDVEFLFGAVSIRERLIDWSGNCGNLSSAVGPFAIDQGLVRASDGVRVVRIWQSNLGHRIDAHVPVLAGKPLESGGFMEDGVPFGAAQIRLEFHEVQGADASEPSLALLPTGRVQEELTIAGLGPIPATLITAGNPTVFIKAQSLGLTGKETADDLARKRRLMGWLEAIRAQAAVRMGLAASEGDATLLRPATPKVAWVAAPASYLSSSGKTIAAHEIDVLARILSMGKLHHAFTGTGSVALAAAAALPGSVVHEIARTLPGLPTRIGHPSGILAVGAQVKDTLQGWRFERAVFSRSARRLFSGVAHVPAGWAVESDATR